MKRRPTSALPGADPVTGRGAHSLMWAHTKRHESGQECVIIFQIQFAIKKKIARVGSYFLAIFH